MSDLPPCGLVEAEPPKEGGRVQTAHEFPEGSVIGAVGPHDDVASQDPGGEGLRRRVGGVPAGVGAEGCHELLG